MLYHLTVQDVSHPYFPQGKMCFSGAVGFIPTAVLPIMAKSEVHAEGFLGVVAEAVK